VWKAELLTHQKEMALAGGKEWSFEVDDIALDIEVTAYVFANRTGERYGRQEYESLIAKTKNTELVAKNELVVRLPLVTAEPISKRSVFVTFDALAFGETYRLLSDKLAYRT